jgi:hypothetical protein
MKHKRVFIKVLEVSSIVQISRLYLVPIDIWKRFRHDTADCILNIHLNLCASWIFLALAYFKKIYVTDSQRTLYPGELGDNESPQNESSTK